MALKLEDQKTYLDREGRRHQIFKMAGVFVNRDGALTWSQIGSSYQAANLDLVREAPVEAVGEVTKNEIPHADLIRAALDGKVVQEKRGDPTRWMDIAGGKSAILYIVQHPEQNFRLKPDPVIRWVPIFRNKFGDKQDPSIGTRINYNPRASTTGEALAELCNHDRDVLVKNKAGVWLRLELDPDTLKVISSETVSP